MYRRILFAGLALLFVSLPLFSQVLFVPGFNQAYSDSHGYWGRYRMGTNGCPDRIETAGCLITSLAAVLDYYEIKLTIPAAESCTGNARTGMDPGIVNDWLRAHGGYGRCATDHTGDCCLEWTAIPAGVSLVDHENRATTGTDSNSRLLIDHALAHGYPVIAGVHWGAHCHGTTAKTKNCHWVVITGKLGSTYLITDPYNRDKHDPYGVRTTLNRGVFGRYTIDRFVVVKGPVPIQKGEMIRLSLPAAPAFGKMAVTLSASTGGDYLIFIQIADPNGDVHYLRRMGAANLEMLPSPVRASLLPTPIRLFPGKNVIGWIDTQEEPRGTYTLLVRLEDPHRSGITVATAIAEYTLGNKTATAASSTEWGIGIAIGAALLITLATILIVLAAKP